MGIKIVAAADLHGRLPEIPPCDILLLGGDICPHFARGFVGDADDITGQATFRQWLDKIPAKQVVATWGNHDWVGTHPNLYPNLRWHLLLDEEVTLNGLKIYGTPWQPEFYSWAFNAMEEQLNFFWSKIPKNTDIIVFHGPPRGYGDIAPANNDEGFEHTGSISQLERIREIKPKLCIFGHIHEGRGIYEDNGVKLANVTILDGNYQMVYKPMEFEL